MNYHTPPPGGHYNFTSASPSPQGPHGFYSPRPNPSPRMHSRHQSQDFPPRPTSAFPSPRYTSKGHYSTGPGYSSPGDHVEYGYRQAYDRSGTPIIMTEDSPRYERYDDTPRRSHSRRHSTTTPQRPATAARPTSSQKKAAPAPEHPKATAADAAKHKIPTGYSLKNWDPTEEPIILLGSVFDANSLGKWIFDWTVYYHGARQPISEMAGELWLLLIQLAGKMKRAEECVPRIRTEENREMVEDFIESGERLMDKLKKLLRACEAPMLRAGGRKPGEKKEPQAPLQLGKNAGIEFVESIFGRDRQLAYTEKFMSSVRLWNLRFDANCEDIISHPYA